MSEYALSMPEEEKAASKMPPMRNNAPDDFQTPPYAVRWLFPYIPKDGLIWEPAEGKGNIVRTFRADGYEVEGSDLSSGSNFLTTRPPKGTKRIITNPPYSIKDNFIARCFALGLPWALLMPATALVEQERVSMYRKHGISLLIPPARINYETPSGKGSGAQFFSIWFCHGIELPSPITFIHPPDNQIGMNL